MKIYTQEELASILDLHAKWLRGENGGIRADLRDTNLRYANLRYANLRYADLRYADLRDANLRDTDMRGASLRYADLRYADLRDTDLRGANLSDTDLSDADLRGANLRYADLSDAKYGNRKVLRAPICVYGARYVVEEHWSGIRIGCENNVTSENLAQLFEKHATHESMRPLYIAAVKMIEEYAKAWPLLSAEKAEQ